MARATKKASASRTTRSRSTAARSAAKAPKKAQTKGGATKKVSAARSKPPKQTAKAAGSKPLRKAGAAAPARKSPKVAPTAKTPAKKKSVKQVTRAPKAGKTTVSAKKAQAKPVVKATSKPAGRVTAKPAKPAAKPAPKPAEVPKPPKKQERPMEPAVAETAAKKPRKRELSTKEIEQIRTQLEEQREAFLREYNDIEEGATISQSEMSGEVSFDEEYADAGTFTFERERDLSIGNNIRDLLDRVNAAINAIDAGTYGFCENCGDPINKARLQALPYSTLCIRCKQLEERTR